MKAVSKWNVIKTSESSVQDLNAPEIYATDSISSFLCNNISEYKYTYLTLPFAEMLRLSPLSFFSPFP